MSYRIRRRHELQRRRHRREKVAKLMKKLAGTTAKAEREKLIEKILTLRPNARVPEK
ncbi:MAG TPA: DUF6800 family protein [Anaerolineales bacterium]|nr:DUF6800 family protein [Anaerolineales bacterium]